MGRVAVFVDAGYFWVQAGQIVHGRKGARDQISLNYPAMRSEFLSEIRAQFPDNGLLRVYWYDGPGSHGKTDGHVRIEELDDFKLRLGTRNGAGDQKAVDGLIIADLIGLAQSKSIANALVVSGDADLTPGVQAAQGLGIRVHLLSMGPTVATSPYLKAEVDQKKHWDDLTVRKFVEPAALSVTSTNAMTPAAPATETAAPTGSQNTSKTSQTMERSASEAFLLTLDCEKRSQLSKTEAIPSDLDRMLLAHAKKTFGRMLSADEKVALRAELKRQL